MNTSTAVSTDSATHISVGDAITAEQVTDMIASTGGNASPDIADYALQLADDSLVLSQRLGWWISRAPEMEEDVALGNIALDVLGHARFLYTYAGSAWGKTEDELAYFRDEEDFRSCRLVEQPNGDFGHTIARQLIFSLYAGELYSRLSTSTDPMLAAIADKAVKEVSYHVDHAIQWLLRLGLGTDESHRRIQAGLESMWPYKDELFTDTETVNRADEKSPGAIVRPSSLKETVDAHLSTVIGKAGLSVPTVPAAADLGYARTGRFSEHRGYIITEMQSLARQHPGATW
ncbi:1,2-phenylacetyl-CoA epoxidase subunit PaaC [Corynebacterium glyciniphilum]|uniref:1,2-phenylacetyl-CoA epoxidase subunit PaaC n=1 Tax=Corynebacterium glyciniphilum TaxID=1404244 RepID=UPI00264C6850|nr:1,2-phenylacetyl-CoA epoxidase subunit PaaC [Corynebacterium glyciniphilum]MDN5682509.1 phenylacetate-CoA oxygenase subunit PaaC [Corynebacterium glyciniphilum]MDN6707135.1 phenylacetate-CoA oxygenase subunit PaaC [Corynebacterium glyciniphilum]